MSRRSWNVRRAVRRSKRVLREHFEWQTSYYGKRRRTRLAFQILAFVLAALVFGAVLGTLLGSSMRMF